MRAIRVVCVLQVVGVLAACVRAPATREVVDSGVDSDVFAEAGAEKPPLGAALPPRDPSPPVTRIVPAAGGQGGGGGSGVAAPPAAGSSAAESFAADGGEPQARAPRPSRHGAVVITELMIDPKALADAEGEWFELYNTEATPLDLAGCAIADGSARPHVMPAMTLAANAFATVARSEQPGFVADVVIAFSLKNAADALALECDGALIDRVSYDSAAGYPIKPGAALALDARALDADDNDQGASWCLATSAYASDLGSPGRLNPNCDVGEDAGR